MFYWLWVIVVLKIKHNMPRRLESQWKAFSRAFSPRRRSSNSPRVVPPEINHGMSNAHPSSLPGSTLTSPTRRLTGLVGRSTGDVEQCSPPLLASLRCVRRQSRDLGEHGPPSDSSSSTARLGGHANCPGPASSGSNAEVADELFISQATVKTHLRSVLRKLAIRDRAAAIVFAHEHALLESPPQS